MVVRALPQVLPPALPQALPQVLALGRRLHFESQNLSAISPQRRDKKNMASRPRPRPRPAEGPGLAGTPNYVCKNLAESIFQNGI